MTDAEYDAETQVREPLSGQAYSEEEPETIEDEVPQQHSWRHIGVVAFALVAFAALAVGLAAAHWHGADPLPDATPTTAAAPPAPQPVTIAAPPDAVPLDPDARYTGLLKAGGWHMDDPTQAIGFAHESCQYRATHTRAQTDAWSTGTPDGRGAAMTLDNADKLLIIAESAYCPQYNDH